MTRHDDKKPGSTTSQDALLDYLQQMLFDASAEASVPDAVVDPTVEASPSDVAGLGRQAGKKAHYLPETTVADEPPVPRAESVVASKNAEAQFAAGEDEARTADLQQKLLQARVKDLAEKSLLAAKEQQQQRVQQAQRESERRERLDAARALVKQRIAARISTNAGTAAPVAEVRTVETRITEAPAIDVAETEIPAARADLDAEKATPGTLPEQQVQQPQAWLENGRPVWAQNAFECLLFSVSGLTLAVPLVELGSIYPIKDHLTPIIGQIDWFLGLLHVHGRNHVRTVNTAKIVMPEKYDAVFVDNIRYVISINGYDWGLAVDNVDKAVTLVPEDVRWRTERSKRPWLAGTVVDYMCALVDVQELAVMLSSADPSKPRAHR